MHKGKIILRSYSHKFRFSHLPCCSTAIIYHEKLGILFPLINTDVGNSCIMLPDNPSKYDLYHSD